MTEQHVSLFYKKGSSDKEYHAHLIPDGAGWVVRFEYGRRGSALQSGTKTASPLPFADAQRIFERLVREKKVKGYTEAVGTAPYVGGANEERVSGVLPQLLNTIDDDTLTALLADDRFCLQEKYDGKRTLLRKTGDTVEGINRKGLLVGLAPTLAAAARRVGGDWVIDGELVGDVLWGFDLLACDAGDQRQAPYGDRYGTLRGLLAPVDRVDSPIRVVTTAFDPRAKTTLIARLEAAGAEGVVFKAVGAPYTPGRPNSGGPQLKFKFVSTASCRVRARVPGKRSVELELMENAGPWVTVGKVTIPANAAIPVPGAIVEVRYLYAYPGGALFQPVYLGERDDIDPDGCLISQLKFKQPVEDDEGLSG